MPFMESFLATKKPKSYTMTKTINRQTIVDQVASFLYATSIINDNVDIANIEFRGLDKDQVSLKIHCKEVK